MVWTDGDLPLAASAIFVTEYSMVYEPTRRATARDFFSHVVWFSPRSVIHASGFDMDSNALTVTRQICGVSGAGGPVCHIISTTSQSAQWVEISKADQQLLAAAEFVCGGDASLEEGMLSVSSAGFYSQ